MKGWEDEQIGMIYRHYRHVVFFPGPGSGGAPG